MINTKDKNRLTFLENLRKTFFLDIRDFINKNNWLRLKNSQWDDIVIGGIILGAATSAPDQIPFGSPPTNLIVYGFDGNNISEQLFAQPEVLHNYKEGTNVYVHVHWTPTDNTAGNVKWFLEYTWANVGSTYGAATTISVIQAASGVAWRHQLAEFPVITGTGKLIGSILNFRFYRTPTDAQDTYTSDAALLSIGIHYEINSFGSRQKLTK